MKELGRSIQLCLLQYIGRYPNLEAHSVILSRHLNYRYLKMKAIGPL